MSNKVKAKDVLLLLLYLPGKNDENNEPIVGKTRITKMMFLFEQELLKNFNNVSQDSLPSFFAYNYGPFSKDLLDDIRFFETIGFIGEEIIDSNPHEAEVAEYMMDINEELVDEEANIENIGYVGEPQFYLTKTGKEFVENELLKPNKFTEIQIDILKKFKKRINTLTLNQLLTYVYTKYDEFTEKSVIREKILGKQEG